MVLLMLIVAPTMSVHAEGERADQEHGDRFGLEVKVEQRDGIAGLSVDCSGCIVDAAVFARHRGNERPQQRPASWLARFEESDGRSVVLVDLPEADLKTVELTAVVVVDDGIGAENVWRTMVVASIAPPALPSAVIAMSTLEATLAGLNCCRHSILKLTSAPSTTASAAARNTPIDRSSHKVHNMPNGA